jgi:dihydrofolate reductase
MRRIVAGLFMSLDGVVETPEKWGYEYFNDELVERVNAGIQQADAVLVGRRTYQEFSEIWPSQGSDVPMSDFLNGSHKYVVSTTLENLDWGPATLIAGHVPEQLRKLKQQPGRNIQIPGSPTLVRSLLREGLLDELTLTICPAVVGSGLSLFEDVADLPLKVVEGAVLSTGVIAITYEPANEHGADTEGSVAAFPEPQR